jgi:hypothetical protein
MKQLREALSRVAKEHPLHQQLTVARIRAEQPPANRALVPELTARERAEQSIKHAQYAGVGNLHPVTFLMWPSGRPIVARGRTCRILGGLSDGTSELLIVRYDHLVPLEGTSEKTSLGLEYLTDVHACPCGGYTHPGACSPKVHPETSESPQP